MPTLTDVRFDTLRSLGYSGAISDMLLQWLKSDPFVPGTTPVRKVLRFGGNTFISIPGAPFDPTKVSKIEYEARMDIRNIDRDSYGSDDATWFTRWRVGLNDYRLFRGGVGPVAAALPHAVNVGYLATEDQDVVGSVEVTLSNVGTATATVGVTGTSLGPWRIGSRVGGNGWVGYIKDFKIYDAVDTLTNHWVIDDNVADGGTILDIVGGTNGTLTLGSGSWEDWPPPAASAVPLADAATIADAWEAALINGNTVAPFIGTAYHRSDWWYAYLGSLGYTGNMNDRELAYWEALFLASTGTAYNQAYSSGYS
jgi:hypothetical protein